MYCSVFVRWHDSCCELLARFLKNSIRYLFAGERTPKIVRMGAPQKRSAIVEGRVINNTHTKFSAHYYFFVITNFSAINFCAASFTIADGPAVITGAYCGPSASRGLACVTGICYISYRGVVYLRVKE